jgi:dynein heavy chain
MSLIAKSLCIIFDEPPGKMPGPKPGTRVDDYWEPARVILADSRFLSRVKEWTGVNKDKLTREKMLRLAPVLEDPEFKPEVMENKSRAATALCQWVHALKLYYATNIIVEPKKQNLAVAERDKQAALSAVAESKRQLAEIEANVKTLIAQHAESDRQLGELKDKKKRCRVCLERAGILTVRLKQNVNHGSDYYKIWRFKKRH